MVALTGDGGLLMCGGELLTAVRERLRIVVIVFADASLSLIEIKQRQRGLHPAGVGLGTIDWCALAASMGAAAHGAGTAADLKAALATALAGRGPTVIEARIDPRYVQRNAPYNSGVTMHARLLLTTTVVAMLAAAGQVPSAQRASARLLVLNKEDANLASVDPASGRVLSRVAVGQGPHELVTSGDGKFAFASNYGSGPAPGRTISMIDLAAMKEVRRIDVSPLSRPHGLAFVGGKLYFTAEADKKIARYDPAADRIDWQFETGQATTHMVLPTADAQTIFTSNIGGDSVSAIRLGAGGTWTQTVIPVGKGPEGIDLSPNGREVWSAHSRDGGVSIIDVASLKVVQTMAIGTARSNRIKLTPDAKFALVSDIDTGEVVVLDRRRAK